MSISSSASQCVLSVHIIVHSFSPMLSQYFSLIRHGSASCVPNISGAVTAFVVVSKCIFVSVNTVLNENLFTIPVPLQLNSSSLSSGPVTCTEADIPPFVHFILKGFAVFQLSKFISINTSFAFGFSVNFRATS